MTSVCLCVNRTVIFPFRNPRLFAQINFRTSFFYEKFVTAGFFVQILANSLKLYQLTKQYILKAID